MYTAQDITYLKLSFACSYLYFTSAATTKLGIVFMYNRIFAVGTALRYRVRVVIALTVGWWVGCIAARLASCVPFKWNWINGVDKYQDYCFNYNVFWMVTGTCEVVLDVLTLVLPLSVLIKMRLSLRQKITSSSIFLLGGL